MEKEKTVKDKVEEISVRTFTIASCPEKVYQRFLKYCKENARNVRFYQDKDGMKQKEEIIYHMGLRLLRDIAETDAKSTMLYEKLVALEGRLALIENKPKEDKPKRKKVKTFGGK